MMRVIDLFCGTGGFSIGAHAAGFEIACAIDVDPVLTSSFSTNFPATKLAIADVAQLTGADLQALIDGPIDGLIGGPPCQGFSLIGKRDGNDPRRQLVDHFFRLVTSIRPTFFVMENVVGLMQGDALLVLQSAMARLPVDYLIVGPVILNASDFGVATSRQRCFIVGVLRDRADIPVLTPPEIEHNVSVLDAIADLANAREIEIDQRGFDVHELAPDSQPSPYATRLRADNNRFTGNRRTVHNQEVIDRFASVAPGKRDPVGRHQRLSWNGLCPTLRAGTGSERGSYQSVRPLHPDEPRVITVREAARLQGFPDSHRFHPTIWHSFRMIGNSVSPPVAKAVMEAVARACGAPQTVGAAAE